MQLNPSKPFMGLFAMFAFGYAIYVLLASDPLTRINRMCTPVTIWPEKIVVSGLRVFSPSSVPAYTRSFNNGFDNCRRWTFGVMYRDEYEQLRAQEAVRAAKEKGQAVTTAVKDAAGGQ